MVDEGFAVLQNQTEATNRFDEFETLVAVLVSCVRSLADDCDRLQEEMDVLRGDCALTDGVVLSIQQEIDRKGI